MPNPVLHVSNEVASITDGKLRSDRPGFPTATGTGACGDRFTRHIQHAQWFRSVAGVTGLIGIFGNVAFAVCIVIALSLVAEYVRP